MKIIKKLVTITFLILPGILYALNSGLKSSPDWHRIPNIYSIPRTDPTNQDLYDKYRFGATYYYGVTFEDALARIVRGELHRWPEHIQSLELAYTLNQCNVIRKFFNPLVGVVQVAANGTMRIGNNQHRIYEFDPYIAFRWANLPWNNVVTTSLSIGEGISYDSSIPDLERKSSKNNKRLLNLLILEATFALPSYPRLQLVARLHHRSGAYGLYRAGNTGSNNLGVGIRYLF